MYRGKNPTALKSQEWLKESLVKLCLVKPYKSITIKELCSHADLSRQTFYMLFNSKDEIIELYIEDYFNRLISDISFIENASINNLLDLAFSLYKNNSAALKVLIDNNLIWILRKKMQEQLSRLMLFLGYDNIHKDILNYSSAFMTGAIIEVIVYLCINDIQKTNEELSELVLFLLKGEYLKEFGLMSITD